MATCLSVATMVLGIIAFICLSLSCGTTRWKEDIDFWKDSRIYTGLWRVCYSNGGNSQAKYPEYYECDKDFLRPQLVEPPPWFNSVRALMLLSVFGSGFGVIFYITAFVTDNSKATGSRYWPSALVMFFGGVCALIALCIFTMHKKEGIQFAYGGGRYFAEFWTIVQDSAKVNSVEYKIETWLRWSYGVGWGGVGFSLLALITAILSDLTRKIF